MVNKVSFKSCSFTTDSQEQKDEIKTKLNKELALLRKKGQIEEDAFIKIKDTSTEDLTFSLARRDFETVHKPLPLYLQKHYLNCERAIANKVLDLTSCSTVDFSKNIEKLKKVCTKINAMNNN